jgi:2-heptyl-3-hydroxy-4(1H)-quinolone synthase
LKENSKILIVGGGVAGLMLANLFQKRGIDFLLIEKATEWKPVGAGFVITPNAIKIFKKAGISDELIRAGNVVGRAELLDASGKVINYLAMDHFATKYGFPAIGIRRSALLDCLSSGCNPSKIRMGISPIKITNGIDFAKVTLSDGSEETFSLVIGADGLRSTVRELCFREVRLRYTGYTSWTFLIPDHSKFPGSLVQNIWGVGKRMGIVPVGNESIYIWASVNSEAENPFYKKLDWRGFRKLFSDLGGKVPGVIGGSEPESELIWADQYDVTVKNWFSGSVVLVGDAAHAMTPNIGQGACMSIEDAGILVECLAENNSKFAALMDYQNRRAKRVNFLSLNSFWLGNVGQMQSSWMGGLRNRIFSMIPGSFNQSVVEGVLMAE